MKNFFNSNNSTGLFKVLVTVGLLLFFVVFGLYIFKFGSSGFSDQGSVWGQFGDYLGGTLNPIFGFLSFIALVWTIAIQSKQISLMQSSLKAAERPWLSLKVMIGENFVVNDNEFRFDVRCVVKNFGKSPAFNCDIKNVLEVFLDSKFDERFEDFYKSTKSKSANRSILGFSIFPNEEQTVDVNIGLPLEKVIQLNDEMLKRTGDIIFFAPVLYSCITYKSNFDHEYHMTSTISHINVKNEGNLGFKFNHSTGEINSTKCHLTADPFLQGIID